MITQTHGVLELTLDKGTKLQLQIQNSNTAVSFQELPELIKKKLEEEIARIFSDCADIKKESEKLLAQVEKLRADLSAQQSKHAEEVSGLKESAKESEALASAAKLNAPAVAKVSKREKKEEPKARADDVTKESKARKADAPTVADADAVKKAGKAQRFIGVEGDTVKDSE